MYETKYLHYDMYSKTRWYTYPTYQLHPQLPQKKNNAQIFNFNMPCLLSHSPRWGIMTSFEWTPSAYPWPAHPQWGQELHGGTNCWWRKSCTTWDVKNLVNNGIFTISTGAGFLPSTVFPIEIVLFDSGKKVWIFEGVFLKHLWFIDFFDDVPWNELCKKKYEY